MRPGLLLPLLAGLVSVRVVAQQSDDALAQARLQLQARNLDSAATLLRRITDSTTFADSSRRVDALVLLGMVRYYQGDEAASMAAFGAAVQIAPALEVPQLAGLDTSLAALFDSAKVRAARTGPAAAVAAEHSEPRDTIYNCSPRCNGLDVEPRRLDTPRLVIPGEGGRSNRAAQRGAALVRVVIDTLGRVEPGSAEVVYSTIPEDILRDILRDVENAQFRPGRAHGHPVRVRYEVRVNQN